MTILLTNSKGSTNIADTWKIFGAPDGVDVRFPIETGDFPLLAMLGNTRGLSSSIITTVSVVVWGYSGSLRS